MRVLSYFKENNVILNDEPYMDHEVVLTAKEIAALVPHEYCLMPLSTPTTEARLRKSIKKTCLHDPIVLFQGKILDGRGRQKACNESGVKPRYVLYEGDDPLTFYLRKNVACRRLTTGQKAIIVVRAEPLFAWLLFRKQIGV